MATQYKDAAQRIMTQAISKMQPWQVFNAARKYLGVNKVAQIFNRQTHSAHDWAQDPSCTEVRCKSPLELLHTLFMHMDTVGLGYVARAAIKYLETAVDPDTAYPATIPLPVACMNEEVLRDYSAVEDLHTVIKNGAPPEVVEQRTTWAKAEIERTLTLYLKNWEKEKKG